MEFKHKELGQKIIGAAFEVHNKLGYGFLEKVYQKSLHLELTDSGLSNAREVKLDVFYKQQVVGEFFTDILVEDKICIEIKVAPNYRKEDEAQLLNQLKASGKEIGYLINFGKEKVEFKRFIKTK